MRYDYIVVGGGTAGCVVAARLTEDPHKKVLVLEAGPMDRHPAIGVPGASAFTVAAPGLNWHRMTEPQAELGGRSLYLAQGRVVGGSSSINGMVYTRGAPGDYAEWVREGAEGWSYQDVLPWFRKAATYRSGGGDWHGREGPLQVERSKGYLGIVDSFLAALGEMDMPLTDDLNAGAEEGLGHYDWMVGRGRRSSTARAYIKPARARQNLTLLPEAHSTNLVIEKGRVVGVDFIRGGQKQRAYADVEVILSGGAINSAQLLLLSGVGPADHLRAVGVDPVLDQPMVGANFRNHLSYKISYRCAAPISAYALFNPFRGVAELAKYGAGRGFLAQGASPAGGFYRSSDKVDRADMQIFMVPLVLGDVGGGFRAMLPKEHGVTFFLNQGRPNSSGTVRLRSADPMDAPAIDPRYLSDPSDLDVLLDGIERMNGIADTPSFRAIGAQNLNPDVLKDRATTAAHVRAAAENHYHVCGTCRIGTDEKTSVVDPRLRVHGLSGLRVADASVMPRMLNANLAAPVVMIGERAAAFIAIDA